MNLHPKQTLSKLVLAHSGLSGLAIIKLEKLYTAAAPENEQALRDAAAEVNTHNGVIAGLVGAAHALLDGDAFTAFCRDAQIHEDDLHSYLELAHRNFPAS